MSNYSESYNYKYNYQSEAPNAKPKVPCEHRSQIADVSQASDSMLASKTLLLLANPPFQVCLSGHQDSTPVSPAVGDRQMKSSSVHKIHQE
jgi:hypothetical protein